MQKKAFFKFLGFAFSVLPPLIATIDQFPLMTAAGKLSVLALVALVLCCIPFVKHLKKLLASPSAWMMWGIVFLLCVMARAIVDEFYVISMLGLVGSLIGAGFFYLAKKGTVASDG